MVLYALLMLGVSLFWMSRVKKAEDYLVAGRGLPAWVLIGTITATCVGTGVVIGASGLAYKHGWAGCAYPIGLGLGTLLTGLWYAKMRGHKFMTLSEEIACFYGRNRIVVEFSTISLFLSQLCWTTVQIMGGGAILGAVTTLPRSLCVVVAGLIIAVISIPGGLKTVVYTDFLQAVILLCGFSILVYLALARSGGLAGLHRAVPAGYFSFLGTASYGTWNVCSLILALILAVIADPGRRLSMYAARSERAAKWGMVIAGLIVIVFSLAVGIIGMFAFHLNPHLPSSDQALPWLITKVLTPWPAAIVVVSVTSAIFSSANGNIAAAGTFYVRHIYPLVTGHYAERPLVSVRRAMMCFFIIATVLALYTGTIVGFVAEFLPVTMSGLAIIILLGHFWKRATWQGAVAALVVTPVVSLALMFGVGHSGVGTNPTIPAFVAGVLVLIGVSLATRREQLSFAEVAENMALERTAVEGELYGQGQDWEAPAQPLETEPE